MKKSVYIIGMGRFGSSAAISLLENGASVTIIDNDEKKLDSLTSSHNFSNCLVLDSTSREALSSTAIDKADHVVVAMSSIEDSIMTCVNLKDINVKTITAKAQNLIHKRVLKSLGIKNVVFPEYYAAIQTAEQIMNADVTIIYSGKMNTILNVTLKNDEIVGLPIIEMNKQQKFFKIFAVRGNLATDDTIYNLEDVVTTKLMKLFIICDNDKINAVEKAFD